MNGGDRRGFLYTIVTMLVHNIPTLLTNNTDDFKRFSHLITVLPLDASVF